MAITSILSVLLGTAEVPPMVAAAGALAQRLGAHLDLLALGIDATVDGYVYLGAGAVLAAAEQERATAEVKAIEAAAREAAGRLPADLRWAVEAGVVMSGALWQTVALRARYADLVVMPRPYGVARALPHEVAIEAALFDGRAPVLVLPEPLTGTAPAARRIVLAWNESAEAMAAVRRALPLLKAADLVSVTVVDPASRGPEAADPGAALCHMLVRHGVPAEVSVLARTTPGVADMLLRHASDLGADLVVMGAYGHSRFREAILGGATRRMLEAATLPVLLAH